MTGKNLSSNKIKIRKRNSICDEKPLHANVPVVDDSSSQDAADEARELVPSELLQFISINDIKPNRLNARVHPEAQIELLCASIETFGFIGSIVIDENNIIVAGHGRLEAARRIGLKSLPCIRIEHLSDDAKTALALADNRLAELSFWNEKALAANLEELSSADLDFDPEITGFDTVDFDRLLVVEAEENADRAQEEAFSEDPEDNISEVDNSKVPVSQLGDMWQLGEHVIVHGDALQIDIYRGLLAGELAAQIVTDPPYNVPNAGHVSAKKFREFAMAHGEMSPEGFTHFLATSLENCTVFARDGAIFHVFIDWRHITELSAAAKRCSLEQKNLCVWTKPSPGQGSFYRSQHELVFVFKHGTSPHTNNFGLGARGRTRSNIWQYPAVRGARSGINGIEAGHPTVKPVTMIIDAIRDCSRRGEIVLDPFGGSGTTLIAAERTGRRARLVELDGHYVDLTIRRWKAMTGQQAVEARSGLTFEAVMHSRRQAAGDGER